MPHNTLGDAKKEDQLTNTPPQTITFLLSEVHKLPELQEPTNLVIVHNPEGRYYDNLDLLAQKIRAYVDSGVKPTSITIYRENAYTEQEAVCITSSLFYKAARSTHKLPFAIIVKYQNGEFNIQPETYLWGTIPLTTLAECNMIMDSPTKIWIANRVLDTRSSAPPKEEVRELLKGIDPLYYDPAEGVVPTQRTLSSLMFNIGPNLPEIIPQYVLDYFKSSSSDSYHNIEKEVRIAFIKKIIKNFEVASNLWKYPISQNLLDPKTLVILEIQKNINDTLHNAQLEGITKLEADPEIMDALIQQLANPKPQNGIMRVASSIIISRELCQKHSLAHALASAIVNPKTQKLLLRNLEPGDYNIANSEGKTPLDVAITSLRPFEHFIKGTLDPNKLLTLIKTSPHKSNTLEVMQYLAEQYKYLDLSNPYVAAQIMQIYASMPKIEKEFKEKFSAFQSKVSFWQQTITPKFIDACSRYKAGDGEQHPLDLIPGFLLFFEPEILTPILETLKGPWLSEGMLYNILQHYIIHTNYTDSLNCRGMENRGCGISRQKIGQTNERFKDAAKSLLNLFTNKEFYNYTSHRMAVEIITGKGNHDIDAFLSRKSEADILYILQQLTSLHGDTKFLSCTSQTTWTDPTGEHTLEAGLLFYALQEGRYDIAHYLLENGINYCSNKLPLMIAIPLFSAPKLSLNAEDTANHNKKMVEFFELVMMRYPYELLATMDDASTILHACCEKPHLTFGIIKALLGQQQTFVKINAPNNSNKTPLDILLSNITDWEAIIKVFGVMIGYEPGEKLSPKVQEDIKTSATIGSILEKMRAKKEKAKHQATKAPQSQDKLPDLNLKLIISDDNRKVLLHTPDSNGDYAMHAACRNPNTETTREVVSTLLRIGFNEFNKANADGDTVLDVLLARPDSTELKDLVDNLRTLGACPNKTYDTDTCGDMNPPEEKLDIDLALMGGNNTDPADHV